MTDHMVIFDGQTKSDVDFSHWPLIGKYIVEKKPDTIVNIGDFADMPSLCTYDRGKKSFEGRRYKKDIEAAKYAMSLLMQPIIDYNKFQSDNHHKRYKPRLVMLLGNHEDRITRAINDDSKLEGVISLEDLQYKESGWEVIPYLKVVTIDGIAYSHYFCSGSMGRPVSSARALLTNKHQSATMGHVQKTDVAMDYAADGRQLTGLFGGCSYLHDEDYLNPQGNVCRRQIVMKYRVNNGAYDLHFVSLDYLFEHFQAEKNKYKYK